MITAEEMRKISFKNGRKEFSHKEMINHTIENIESEIKHRAENGYDSVAVNFSGLSFKDTKRLKECFRGRGFTIKRTSIFDELHYACSHRIYW